MQNQGIISKNLVLDNLRKEIMSMQGFKRVAGQVKPDFGLGEIEAALPGNSFPLGAVHEFASASFSHVASTNAFIAGIISKLMQKDGACLWIGSRQTLFPPALKHFGIDPERVIFAHPAKSKDLLWTIEEALKCNAVTAVVGELSELSFTESRRLQLAVENSQVTGFIHRINARSENTITCVTRWRITPIESSQNGKLPGLGRPRWKVELAKVRNGRPGKWEIEWTKQGFRVIDTPVIISPSHTKRKVV